MTTSSRSESDSIHVLLEVGDQESLRELLSILSESTVSVHTEAITSAELSGGTTVEFDLNTLTDKQREALNLALGVGYYERPREADLTDLAEELDISKSAVSQRLRTAEHKLIKEALGQYS